MDAARTAPCGTCPYRRSTPVGIWHPAEYENLREQDANEFSGRSFGCHEDKGKSESGPCLGWLADQKRRGIPSIQLRLRLMRDEALVTVLQAVNEDDTDLYGSIAEMCEANRGKPYPRRTKKKSTRRGSR